MMKGYDPWCLLLLLLLFMIYYLDIYNIASPFKDALSSKHFIEKAPSLFWLVKLYHDSLFLKL